MTNNRLIFMMLAALFIGCQQATKSIEVPTDVKLYDKPEEEGGEVIHVTATKLTCQVETTKTLKMFRYYKISCGDISGWLIDGDQF